MRIFLIIFAVLALAMPASAQETGEVTPLFRDDAPIEVRLTGPIRRITSRMERSTDGYPAVLEAAGERHEITLSARGNSRRDRDNCRFPPLAIEFEGGKPETSLFDRQGRIKLVVHCRDNDLYEQLVLREYTAYRLLNALTPYSFRVRLARVTYVDDGEEVTARWGFFIEDIGDAARRLGMRQSDLEEVPTGYFDAPATARIALFHYMIGNLDFAMNGAAEGERCCHNGKLLGPTREAREGIIPVPYDFDLSGLVDAPYSFVPPGIPVRTTQRRHYRGYCPHNEEVVAMAASFRAARPALEAEIAAVPALSDRSRSRMLSFLEGFFEDIADEGQIRRRLLRNCR